SSPVATGLRLWLGPTELAVVEDVDDELLDSLEDASRAEVAVVARRRNGPLCTQNREDCDDEHNPHETFGDTSHDPSFVAGRSLTNEEGALLRSGSVDG